MNSAQHQQLQQHLNEGKSRNKRSECEPNQRSRLRSLLLLGLIFGIADVAFLLKYVSTHHPPREFEEESNIINNINNNVDSWLDKGPILNLLREAGITHVDDETMLALPTWSEVTALYGDHPRIFGLDQCEVFQSQPNPTEHVLAIAGTFNSGTNLLAGLFVRNCHLPARMKKYGPQSRGVRWQVPWGKHTPPVDEEFRNSHKTQQFKDEADPNDFFPVVTIRDPYFWMNSMCRNTYATNWPHTKNHCPNLVPDERDISKFPELLGKTSVPVRVRYAKFKRFHQSLAHMWNDWYLEYVDATFPRIIVRFEDLVFHPKEVTEAVCHCAGGKINNGKFTYMVDSAKEWSASHGKDTTSYIDAIIRYGKGNSRLSSYSPDDLAFAQKTLDRDLMEFFGYLDPPTIDL